MRATTLSPIAQMMPATPGIRSHAAGGSFGIDHLITYDNGEIWKRTYQKDLIAGAAIFVAGGCAAESDDSKFGDTFWRSFDSMTISAATTGLLKFTFSRERPSQTSDPQRFFTGHGNQRFPGAEVAAIAGAVKPFLAECGSDHPAIYAFEALPLHDAIARVHWQGLVTLAGIWAEHREHPRILNWLPGGRPYASLSAVNASATRPHTDHNLSK
ncbi:MAG: phosphatase PAP2 family protein [Rhodanobacteraceae bacterium]